MWNEYPPINIADKFEVEPETFELIPEEELNTALEKVGGFFAQLKMYRETGSENIKAELSESLKQTQQYAAQALETLSAINDFSNQIADNKIALGSDWDFDILQSEIEELQSDGFDLDGLGLDFEFQDASNMDADMDDIEQNPESPKNEYPVYISLSRKDYERWKVIRGKDNDTQAFLRITNALD
jgi:hypothetical protein